MYRRIGRVALGHPGGSLLGASGPDERAAGPRAQTPGQGSTSTTNPAPGAAWGRPAGRLAAVAALALALSGCAGHYSRPGLTDEDWQRDRYECTYAANALPRTPQTVMRGAYGVPIYSDPTLGWGDALLSRQTLDACLKARGYTRE